MSTRAKRSRFRLRRGSILLDALVGIFVLTIATLSYLSLTVTTHRSHAISKDDSKAAQMAGRLIEQIQLLKVRDLNVKTLTALNLVDKGSIGSPYYFSNIPLDEGTKYSPAQALVEGRGILFLEELSNKSVRATAFVIWRSSSGRTKLYRTGTIVGIYR
jgi:hypothetical protein